MTDNATTVTYQLLDRNLGSGPDESHRGCGPGRRPVGRADQGWKRSSSTSAAPIARFLRPM
jgi:hypothetical protein